ncbi:MAG: aminodeoxychorismate/anthranilate synthase component II [Candidatus Wallbacteria bacterium]|nr:aminodeoxychorismate/anthranilate synthase component II [Candidatus Wallbacteria bacterium]
MILVIDNYDSFVYNLVQYLGEMGRKIKVVRNNHIDIQGIRMLKPSGILLSPGPCTPQEAGICLQVIRELGREFSILGVCLGHQAIGEAFGGRVIRAQKPVHGKTSDIRHDGKTLFRGVPDPVRVARYHSLMVERESLPDCLEVSAWTDEGTIMGLRHREMHIEGVQFHPESIITEHGRKMLRNFIEGD